MALDWKTKTITLAKGMRDDVDQFQLEPPHTAVIRNGLFTKEGTISKRPGLDEHTPAIANAGTPSTLIPTDQGYVVVGTEKSYSTGGAYSEIPSPTYATKKYSEYTSRSSSGAHSFHYTTDGTSTVCCWIETLTASSGTTAGKEGEIEQLEAGILHVRVQFPSGKVIEDSVSGYVAAQTHISNNQASIIGLTSVKNSALGLRYDLGTEAKLTNFSSALSFVVDTEFGNIGTTHTQLGFSFEHKRKFQTHVNGFELYIGFTYDNLGVPTLRLLRFDITNSTLLNSVDFLANANILHMTADSSQLMILSASTAASSIIASRVVFGGIIAFNTATITIGAGETVVRGAWYSNGTDQCVVYTSKEENTNARGIELETSSHSQSINYYTVKTVAEYDTGNTGTFTPAGTFEQEQLITEPLITEGRAVFGIAPVLQHPFLNYAGNTEETSQKTLPLLYKPVTGVVVDSNGTIFGLLAQNEGHAYDYIKQGSSDEVVPAYLVAGDYYFGCRKIVSSGADAGRFTIISPSKLDKVRMNSFATCSFEINRFTVSEGRESAEAERFHVLTGGCPSLLSEGSIGLGCVPNAPELVAVESLNVFPSANPVEMPSCDYGPFEGFVGGAGPPKYFVQGIILVIAKGVGEGVVRSAPSETVWVPMKLDNSSLVEFAMTNFRFLYYAPDVLGDDYKVEVYAFTAQDDIQETSTGTTPTLVGEYPLKKASLKNVVGGPSGYNFIDVNLSLDSTQGRLNGTGTIPRLVSESSTRTLYSDSEVAADVIPSLQVVAKGNDRVFGVDDYFTYFSKPLFSNSVPEFNSLFRVGTTRSRPKAIASLDDKMIIFYRDGISVLVGSGVDASGIGPGYFIQDMPGSVGVKDPKSVVRTDEGIIFRSDRGFYLLDRGLNAKPLGGVVNYLKGTRVSAAVDYKKENTVVFSLEDTGTNLTPDGQNYTTTAGRPPVPNYGTGYQEGEALAYNYRTGDWSILTNHAFKALVYNDEKLIGVGSDWKVSEYGDGFSDSGNPSNAKQNLLYIKSPWIKFTNMQDYAALRKVTCLFRYYSELVDDGSGNLDAGDVNVLMRHDYEHDPNEEATTIKKWAPSQLDPSPERSQISFRSPRRKCQSVQLVIYETPTLGVGFRVGRGFELSAIDLQVGLKSENSRGSSRLRKERKK